MPSSLPKLFLCNNASTISSLGMPSSLGTSFLRMYQKGNLCFSVHVICHVMVVAGKFSRCYSLCSARTCCLLSNSPAFSDLLELYMGADYPACVFLWPVTWRTRNCSSPRHHIRVTSEPSFWVNANLCINVFLGSSIPGDTRKHSDTGSETACRHGHYGQAVK